MITSIINTYLYLYQYTYQYTYQFIYYLYNKILREPFFIFYLKGPHIIGCWEGIDLINICSQLSGTTAHFWITNMDECNVMINNKFESYYILLITILYCMFLIKIYEYLWWRYFVYTPIINKIDYLIKNNKFIKN